MKKNVLAFIIVTLLGINAIYVIKPKPANISLEGILLIASAQGEEVEEGCMSVDLLMPWEYPCPGGGTTSGIDHNYYCHEGSEPECWWGQISIWNDCSGNPGSYEAFYPAFCGDPEA